MSWRIAVRLLFQAVCPVVGVLLIGHAGIVSIGGDIRPAEFGLGILLIAATFLAELVPPDRPPVDGDRT